MNAIKSINTNTFITDLEKFLLTEEVGFKLSFENFTSQLWNLLCILKDNQFRKLSNQIGLKYIKNNIGNVREKILELLGLQIYL